MSYSHSYRCLSSFYGELRGYGRRRIQRDIRAGESATPEEIAELSTRLFRRRVHEAMETFPRYRAKVGNVLKSGTSIERVCPEHLPIWTRGDQRTLFAGLDGSPVAGSFVHSTGGSTGQPLKFYVTRESYEWRTAVSNRGYSWAEAEEGRRSFYVWGTPVYPPSRRKQFKLRLHHRLQRRTYFDSFQFDDEQKVRCCEAINRTRPHALVGYAGNLVELARFVARNPDALEWKARTLVTAAEGLHPDQRDFLEQTLADRVFMSYGSREFMLIGMECSKHNGYHISADNLLVEVVDEAGQPLPPGKTGRILITDLHNAANPFIRYEIGDLGALADPGDPCPCGLPFPRLARVDGRSQEAIVRRDGSKLTALFIPHLMKEFEWIDGYQVAQNQPGRMSMNLVTQAEFSEQKTAPIEIALRAKVGEEMQIQFARVAALTKTATGKTPIVISAEPERLM